jgi:hypothetical protein
VLSAGSVLTVVAVQEGWYEVEFHDAQWGRRVGFVAMTSTRINAAASTVSAPIDLSLPELKPKQLEPMDLSIREPK